MAMLLSLFLFLGSAASAEIAATRPCETNRENRFWEGLNHVDQDKGPAWGEDLYDKLPTPFAWLVLFENRDKDIAERRAPLNLRWEQFDKAKKCAYFNRYAEEILERKRRFEELVGWKEDGKLTKSLAKLRENKEDIAAAQEGPLLRERRRRFAEELDWLELNGLEDEAGTRERAQGIFIRIGRLKSAYLAFQQESGWFEAQVRLRLAAARADSALETRLPEALRGMLAEPAVLERVVAEIAQQLSQDWRNKEILGGQFQYRTSAVLAQILRERKAASETAQVKEIRREITLKKLSRKAAQRMIDGIEKDLKKDKIVFPAGADARLLISLEEYRRGRADLYPLAEEGRPREELVAAYLGLLKEVCVAHYTGIRYKERVIATLCGS